MDILNIQNWGGSIDVESVLGVGTTLTIRLPIKDRAKWYLPRLKFSSDSKIYVLDDQESGRALWRLKFDDTEEDLPTSVPAETDSVLGF